MVISTILTSFMVIRRKFVLAISPVQPLLTAFQVSPFWREWEQFRIIKVK
jgi:hypothetical protein